MKQLFVVLMTILFLLPLVTAAHAGGPPPNNFLKGTFTRMDLPSRTAVFVKDGTNETRVLTLGESMTSEDIRLNKKVIVTLDVHADEETIKDISIMFMDITLQKVISLIVIGFVGGLLSGFIGSGGAFILTPAMMSLGVPGVVAVASNMCHKFPKAMVGAYKRFKYGQVDLKLAIVMSITAIPGIQIGIQIQKFILSHWGNAGSNLYISFIFIIVLVVVGGYVLFDAYRLSKGGSGENHQVSKLAQALMKINIPPMIHFKVAKVRISAWVTVPIGLATGMLASIIAVGGFIGVPGMIYFVGASAIVASATELSVAFIMGFWGSIQWGLSGLIDIRLTLLLLSTSLIGVQIGALGTTYVKDYVIKIVMSSTMLIVAVSRGAKIPGYLADLELRAPLDASLTSQLNSISFWALVLALGTAGLVIISAIIKGMVQAKNETKIVQALSHVKA
jgi:uncharacterized membrane protein YfcA